MYEFIQWLHLAAGIVWLGGMTLLLWAVRPAAIALLPPPLRLLLLLRKRQPPRLNQPRNKLFKSNE